MTELPENYARVLDDLNCGAEAVQTARMLLSESPELRQALESPMFRKSEKRAVIDRLFPEPVAGFVKVMSDNEDIDSAEQIFAAYDALQRQKQGTLRAVFTYVTEPGEEQIARLKEKICRDYGAEGVELVLQQDETLLGGFILKVGDMVLDRSIRTEITRLKQHLSAR